MQQALNFFLVAFPAVFTIVNPLGAVGPFLAMSARDSSKKRLSTATRASMLATIVLFMCTAVGSFLFRFFGITLPALQIAGGSILFLVGMDMINARESGARGTEEERNEGTLKDDIAVFPLGIPLLSGPGAIVSVFILVDRASGPLDLAAIYVAIAATMLITWVLLRQASHVARWLGATGTNVMSRLMGLILAAIAVQFILNGLAAALPGLAGR